MRAPITAAPARGMRRRGAEVGRPSGRRHLRREALELAATDVLEVLARRVRRRLLVQVDRHAESRRRPRRRPFWPARRSRPSSRPRSARTVRRRRRRGADARRAACGDRCRRRRVRTSASTAARTPAASPANVNTERLCDASDETSSSATPATAADGVGHRRNDLGRRPSLTFGTHSISMRTCSIIADAFHVRSAQSQRPLARCRGRGVASDADRDAKIEQLLLLGLDHYFAARYELAINVWTRALFFDRSHPRARAYIERARSALAERQRESEELLHTGVAAFQRGEGDEARRLLQAAIEGGAPTDEALAVLDRLDRLETAVSRRPPTRTGRPVRQQVAVSSAGRSRRPIVAAVVVRRASGVIVAGGTLPRSLRICRLRTTRSARWFELRGNVANHPCAAAGRTGHARISAGRAACAERRRCVRAKSAGRRRTSLRRPGGARVDPADRPAEGGGRPAPRRTFSVNCWPRHLLPAQRRRTARKASGASHEVPEVRLPGLRTGRPLPQLRLRLFADVDGLDSRHFHSCRRAASPSPLDDLPLIDAATPAPPDVRLSTRRRRSRSHVRRCRAAGRHHRRRRPRAERRRLRDELTLFGPPIPDDEPLITQASPPRPPLAVRRATPEVPRLRSEPRLPSLDLALEADREPSSPTIVWQQRTEHDASANRESETGEDAGDGLAAAGRVDRSR